MNKIIYGDSREVLFNDIIPNDSVQLVVTSPPYYNERAYSHWDTFEQYMNDMRIVMEGCWRVLKTGGAIVWNIQFFGDHDLASHASVSLERVGFKFSKDVIIWVKPEGMAGARVKHISGRGLYFPSVITEAIYIYQKGKKINRNVLSDDEKKIMLDKYRTNVWNIKPVIKYVKTKDGVKNTAQHLAPYPEELVMPFILAYSRPDDIVLDPFLGSGTTCLVAKKLGRQWIGIEKSRTYCDVAEKRMEEKDLFI